MSTPDHHASPSAAICDLVERLAAEVGRSVFGHQDNVRLLAGAFLIGGHVLVEGPPGVAKTLMARAFAQALGLRFNRIQFTPDLMPSDVTGVYVFDQKAAEFRFSPGPLFADVILADEINRTSPKTQSALLEAMEERFVTIDGTRHPLGDLFFVIATQNPVEHEGTFPLPEAQLDRFLFKLRVSYPGEGYEEQMIQRFSSALPEQLRAAGETGFERAPVVGREELELGRALLRRISMDSSIANYIVRLVERTREHSEILLGASPRAALNLALAAKLTAALDGRDYVVPDDVKKISGNVLAHRLMLSPEHFHTELTVDGVLAEIVNQTPVPDRPLR